MAALTKARGHYRAGDEHWGPIPVKGEVKIYDGAGIVVDDTTGYAEPATAAAAKTTVGVADLKHWSDRSASGQAATLKDESDTVVDTTGVASGVRFIVVRRGNYMMNNKAGDAFAATDVGKTAYWEDDNTVRKTGTGSSAAGKFTGLDSRTGLPRVEIAGYGRL